MAEEESVVNIVREASYLTASPNLSTTTKIKNPAMPAAISSGLRPVNALNDSIPVLAAYRARDANEEITSKASCKVDQVGMIQMISAVRLFEIPQKRSLDRKPIGRLTRGLGTRVALYYSIRSMSGKTHAFWKSGFSGP
jgi:hypothetical protein